MTRRALAGVAALALLGCSSAQTVSAPTQKPEPAPTRPAPAPKPDALLDTPESRTVAKTLGRVSQLRGIPTKHPVPGVKLERDELVGKIKQKALREYPPDALRREGELLQLFGFAPSSFDYLAETMTLLEDQLEGFYEPTNGTMYLAADLRGKEAEATLAHELVHALQDQSWDLESRSTYHPGKGDETLALACLAEGDATSAMIDYMFVGKGRTALDLPENALRQMMLGGMSLGATATVPHILRASLVAPYVDGLEFVHALRRKGGWPMVDRAWRDLPTTTEQILHVDKWIAHEAAIAVATPTAQALGAGFTLEDEDTFGELGFALAFEEWVSRNDARAAASGWGGDRSVIYARADEIAFAVHVRYDEGGTPSDAFAARALAVLKPGLAKLGKVALDTKDASCIERSDLGPIAIVRRGRDLVLTLGPAKTKPRWTSTSTCTTATKWASEVLAKP